MSFSVQRNWIQSVFGGFGCTWILSRHGLRWKADLFLIFWNQGRYGVARLFCSVIRSDPWHFSSVEERTSPRPNPANLSHTPPTTPNYPNRQTRHPYHTTMLSFCPSASTYLRGWLGLRPLSLRILDRRYAGWSLLVSLLCLLLWQKDWIGRGLFERNFHHWKAFFSSSFSSRIWYLCRQLKLDPPSYQTISVLSMLRLIIRYPLPHYRQTCHSPPAHS